MFLLRKWIDFSEYINIFKRDMEELSFAPERLSQMLKYMGLGMLVIFVIIGVIIATTIIVNKVFSNKK